MKKKLITLQTGKIIYLTKTHSIIEELMQMSHWQVQDIDILPLRERSLSLLIRVEMDISLTASAITEISLMSVFQAIIVMMKVGWEILRFRITQ